MNKQIITNPISLNLPVKSISNGTTFSYKCVNNKNWSMNFLSEDCEVITGFSATKITSGYIDYGDIIHELDRDVIWNNVQTALDNNKPFNLQYRIHTAAGTEKILFEQGQGIYSRSGKLIELTGFISDITQLSTLPSLQIKNCINDINRLAAELGYISQRNITSISEREVLIAIYCCQGMCMKEIAQKLQLSYRTVEGHLNRIKMKLGCHTKTQLRSIFLRSEIAKELIKNYW